MCSRKKGRGSCVCKALNKHCTERCRCNLANCRNKVLLEILDCSCKIVFTFIVMLHQLNSLFFNLSLQYCEKIIRANFDEYRRKLAIFRRKRIFEEISKRYCLDMFEISRNCAKHRAKFRTIFRLV